MCTKLILVKIVNVLFNFFTCHCLLLSESVKLPNYKLCAWFPEVNSI